MKGDGACSSTLKGRSILVVGGTGSFGRAFVRRALDDGARRICIYSRDEAKQAAMRAEFADPRARYMIGDVRDLPRLTDACRGVDVVVHAAALKRVEVCENDPAEAVATNIIGSNNVARACIANGVGRALLLSTDKAAAPNTLYGATKLVAERTWLQSNVYSAGTPTRFSATRYGNVVGSRGSVVPLFRQQAETGELTITDARMTRFFMSMDEAVDLVVLALTQMRGGEVFVPKIGSASIVVLAGTVAPDCNLRIVGIRPGEKIHEVLITEEESRRTWDCGSHFVIEPDERTWGDVPLPDGRRVPEGFVLGSATAPNIAPERLKELVA